jgi:hypothetical protein
LDGRWCVVVEHYASKYMDDWLSASTYND